MIWKNANQIVFWGLMKEITYVHQHFIHYDNEHMEM